MDFLKKQIDRKIKESYSEKEAALNAKESSIEKRFQRSREYRIMLRDYAEKLKEREKLLADKEAAYKIAFDEKIKELKAEQESNFASKHQIQADIDQYKSAIYNAEFRLMDYAKRYDDKDRDIFNDIMKDAQAFKAFNSENKFDGIQFENYVSSLLKKAGYLQVEVTNVSQDFGADILAEKDGVKFIFQCKYYASSVGIPSVQEAFGAKIHYKAHVAAVITNSVFTEPAKILAEETGVLLWDCKKLAEMEFTSTTE